ncbi:armadillo repeat-containing protein 6 homolog [Epargyreus clarus]|uniref:armadillo repeat-containing protein 6 homolog n=1 Tax=Epargyreus clarus TaxID=520877 RepID=UPI003C2B246F
MVRVITQETYDEVVQENIEEFDMSPEEAVKEAIAQFEAQGVDLSNIIKDLVLSDGNDHLVSSTLKKLEKMCASNDCNEDSLIQELKILMSECEKDIAHRIRAGKEGAYKILINLLESRHKSYTQETNVKDKDCIISVLNTLSALMEMQPDLLDQKGIDLIKDILDKTDNEDILISTLKWLNMCCLKHELNRQRIFERNIGDNFKIILKKKGNPTLLIVSLQAIRKFALDDDIRVEFGKAHEHARELGVLLLETLAGLLKENTKPPVVSELLLTMATLLVRHELCAAAADSGIDVLFTILADNYDDVAVTQQATKLITALAGNDDVKWQLVKSGIVSIIVSLLTRHSNNAAAAALTLKCMAALALREPAHGRELLDNGAAEAVVQCLKLHPRNASVQKNACWAIRNMVSRYRDQNAKFHELNIQGLLDEAYKVFGAEFGFDIKSALRDLDCDVTLDEQWTGKGVQMDG